MVHTKRVGVLSIKIWCHLPLTNIVGTFSNSWNWKNRWRERIPSQKKMCSELAGTHFTIGLKKSDENSGVQKVRNWINCKIPRNSEQISQPSCSGKPISPGRSNRTICVGLNCWIISWTIPCLNSDHRIWLRGNWRLIWKSPNIRIGIWCCRCSPHWNVISQQILMQHWQGEFSLFCTIYCLYAPVYVGSPFLDNACLTFLQH